MQRRPFSVSQFTLTQSRVSRRYLLERASGTVYEPIPATTARPQWPKALGAYDRAKRLVTLRASAGANSADVFTALDTYLKTQRKKFSEVCSRGVEVCDVSRGLAGVDSASTAGSH